MIIKLLIVLMMVCQIAHVHQSLILFNVFDFVDVVIAMYVFLLFVDASSLIGIDRSFFYCGFEAGLEVTARGLDMKDAVLHAWAGDSFVSKTNGC